MRASTGDNTIVIKSGQGANYDNRAHTITPIPVAQSSQQQFVQYNRRLPHLLLRQALDRETIAALARPGHVRGQAARRVHVRDGRHAAGRRVRRLRQRPGVEVRADLRRSVHRRRGFGDHVRQLHARRQFPGAADLGHAPGRRPDRARAAQGRDQSRRHGPVVRRRRRRLRARRAAPRHARREDRASSPTACS